MPLRAPHGGSLRGIFGKVTSECVDQLFLAFHNFDADIPPVNYIERVARENQLLFDGFIEGRGGQRLSVRGLHEETGIHPDICRAALHRHPLVRRVRERGKSNAYMSLAPALEPMISDDAPARIDSLGRQAREERHELIEVRILQMRQGRKGSSFGGRR